MKSDRKRVSTVINTDLVIIGAGGAGLPAAVSAAETGLKNIVILEKNKGPGGNMLFAEGTLATETALQKQWGTDTTNDIVFKKAMSYSHWKLNARLTRALLNISGDNIRWLESKGIVFDHLVPHFIDQVPVTFHATETGKTGATIVKVLLKNCQELKLKIFTDTEAKQILLDKSGYVRGVTAMMKGEKVTINTKTVIIATGGFAGNKELLKKYAPGFNEGELFITGMPHKGDGLRMAMEAGADTDGLVTLENMAPFFQGCAHITTLSGRPNNLWLNKNGERFVDESAPPIVEVSNAIYRQPGKIAYCILDRKILEANITQPLSPVERMGIRAYSLEEAGIKRELNSKEKAGKIAVSKSWNDIARFIGISALVLKKAVDEYNRFCEQGYDELFLKEKRFLMPLKNPPYYVIPVGIQCMLTHGGIRINERAEVVTPADKAIPGLYAAGVEAGGTDGDTYNMNLSGHSSSFAIGSGRIAGREAAKYIRKLK